MCYHHFEIVCVGNLFVTEIFQKSIGFIEVKISILKRNTASNCKEGFQNV